MTIGLKSWAAGLSLGLLAACQAGEPAGEPAPEPAPAEFDKLTPEAAMECPVLESTGWTAWINRMPGMGDGPTLHVTGDVVLPTPGYTLELVGGIMDRAMPPGLHLKLVVTPPPEDEMVLQVLTTETVSYETEALESGYRVIHVECGGRRLASITEIGDAH